MSQDTSRTNNEAECKHEKMYLEFRDQFPRKGEKFDPKSNGAWRVCENCGHEEQDEQLTLAEIWERKRFKK